MDVRAKAEAAIKAGDEVTIHFAAIPGSQEFPGGLPPFKHRGTLLELDGSDLVYRDAHQQHHIYSTPLFKVVDIT